MSNPITQDFLIGVIGKIEADPEDPTDPSISPQLTDNFLEIISLNDLGGDPVIPTAGRYEIYVRTAESGGFRKMDANTIIDATLTGGELMPPGETVAASFVGNVLEAEIIPIGIIGAVAYRVVATQNISTGYSGRAADKAITDAADTDLDGISGINIFPKDNTSPIVDFFLCSNVDTFTLSAPMVVDSNIINVTGGHGILVGDCLTLQEDIHFSQFVVLAINVNAITVDSPIDFAYSTGITHKSGLRDMAVDGSSAPVIFELAPIPGISWHISRMFFSVSSINKMDFTKFGSIAPLVNGCLLRIKNGNTHNVFNWKTNGAIITRGSSHDFVSKEGGGEHAFVAESAFSGQAKRGAAVRVSGDDGDAIQVVIQDDLSSLGSVSVVVQGHQA